MNKTIIIGRVGAAYGVRGWLKVISFTDPYDNILHYHPLFIHEGEKWTPMVVDEGKRHGDGVVLKFSGCDDPEHAKTFTNKEIAIEQGQLPKLPSGEYYWHELEDMTVVTTTGTILGKVDHLVATGSNDVLVIKGKKQHLIPYLDKVVLKVDPEKKQLTVDWDTDF